MKKYIIAAIAILVTMPMAAQETYENAKLAENDLNGTARYVGMGGAMEALGADISTISTNPAGIGLFRKSSANVSFGFVSLQDAADFANANKTYMSFDQAGFVYSTPSGRNGFLNFAFNYHKSKNFDFILSAADQLGNASQNKLTYSKQKEGLLYTANSGGVPNFEVSSIQTNQLDFVYAPNFNYDSYDNMWYYENATNYTMNRSHTGYIGVYDFNLSGNINNRVYLGMTVGLHSVHYKHYGEYTEFFPQNSPVLVADDREITGEGADIKFGIIFRPVETSPFRIGLSVATPTWYDLTTRNYTTLSDAGGTADTHEEYDFRLNTPWKMGISLGHTVGNYLALGASWEFADYSNLDTRIKTGEHYDWLYDEYRYDSESDDIMNRHTEQTLKGVSTLKLGAEYKPDPALSVRFGYNYVSPMYQKNGFKDGTLASEGSYYSSATDFTNWEATHRITCGLGVQLEQLNLSMGYQYSAQNGYFEPFMSYLDGYDPAEDNICNAVKVSNKRHQVVFTATYTF